MTRALLLILAFACMLIACNTQRMICPAYQSNFYFDQKKQKEAFVFYNDNKDQPREVLASNSKTLNLPARDSAWENSHVIQGPALPFERKVKKEKYLLLPKKSYKQALRALQTVPMKPVYPKIGEDSLDIKKALDSAARSITDTITSIASAKPKEEPEEDSVYVITKEKEKFNLDQDNYMWYFRDILVLPDVKAGMDEANAAKEESSGAAKGEKKGFFAKLKGLFKRKPKQEVDTASFKKAKVDPFLEPDSTLVQPQPQTPQVEAKPEKKKGGLFRKKSKTQDAPPPPKQDAKKEEKDGF
jgi:hypothetical protein